MSKNCLFCKSSKTKDVNNLWCIFYGLVDLRFTCKAENCEYYEEELDDF